jgi:uncharacterized membrane protein YhaH (DUF805 family)
MGQGNEMNAYLDAMKNYANFSGRSTRSQYWMFTLVYIALFIIGLIIDVALGFNIGSFAARGIATKSGSPIAGLIVFIHLLPSIAILVRRLHDIDKSGWWMLICIIPFGGIVLLVFCCTKSSVGENRFGRPVGIPTSTPSVPTPNSTSFAMTSSSMLERLEKLATLKSSGALDEAEFQKLKSEMLNQTR